MNLMVTGATGFVGRNLVLSVLKNSRYEKIFLPVRSVAKLRAQFLADGFSEIPAQIVPLETDAGNWKFPSLPAIDHLVHCAGVIFARTREEYWDVNVEGTLRLLRAVSGLKKTVLLSSQSAAGPTPDTTVARVEGDTDSPLTWYGMSKLEMESRVRAEFPNLNSLVLRPPMIFGPRDHATLPLFKMTKRPFHFKPGWKSKRYSFIAVEDLVNAIEVSLADASDWKQAAEDYYFVCSDSVITDRELIREAAKVNGKTGVFIIIPQVILKGLSRVIDTIPTWRATIPSLSVDRAKEIWPSAWVASPAKFQKRFGWKARQSFSETVRATFDWYLRSGQLS